MAKPHLFLLPGLLCDELVWEHQREALAPYAEVTVPVFRGFDDLTAMAQSVLDQAPQRFSVVGHSMGGRVAFELMQLAGNRIDKFAVMDTGVHPVAEGEGVKRQILLDAAKCSGLQAVADAWIKPMIHPDRHDDAELIKAINDMILRNTVADYEGQVKALLGRSDQSLNLATIEQKVLLICGDEDNWSPVSQHEAMQKHLQDSELKVIRRSGHMTTMEQADEVSQILVNWTNDDVE